MSRLAIALVLLASITRTVRADDDRLYSCNIPDPSTKIAVSFKPETSLVDLAVWVTGFTCKNVVFSSDVAKRATRVTVVSSKQMSPKQALQLFVDAVESTGMVVTQKPDTIIIKLGPKMPRSCPDLAATVNPGDGGELAGNPFSPPPEPGITDADLDAGIKRIDANHHVITRALLDRVLVNPMAIAKGARVIPAVKNGAPNGFKLYAIRPSSLYARIGLVNGDTITRINGLDVSSADKALEVYTKIRDAATLVLLVERGGKSLTLTLDIQ
jgi:hypothetical protein